MEPEVTLTELKPVFMPRVGSDNLVKTDMVRIERHVGFATRQKKKTLNDLHRIIKKKYGFIEMYPKVRECTVVGVDDELQGQSVKVFVVKDNPSLSKKEIIGFVKKNLAGYKYPRHVEFIDELPKSTVGKILRHKLRALKTKKDA